jgi:hypothetical protein
MPTVTTPAATTTEPVATPIPPEELEQVAAPVALYPDSLLAQVLMASTYPLEIVQADRWVKANPSLKGDALADALNKQTWDASVKSLVNFPQVLTMMSEKLEWTIKLGDAFIADQKAVMDAVQKLRAKAKDNGNLQSNQQQTVTVEQAPAAAPNQPAQQTIVIQSAQPSTVYVPAYNPSVVYGTWPYPAYPPVYYPPPGYAVAGAAISFGAGVALGAAWGHAWGNCNWHGGDVDVDVNRNTNFNRSIDRNTARTNIENRTRNTAGARTNSFQHDPAHRKGAPYRDASTNQRYRGTAGSQQAAQARSAYRGRAEAGRQDIARGGASAYRGGGAAAARPAAANRGAAGTYNRQPSTPRSYSTGTRSSGFSGAGSSAANTRAASYRGQSSRASSSYSRPSGGGGARMGGGSRAGGRGGGGRGGGRR